ncbi:MAG: fructose-6-phosphate aldolase [Thermoplasmatales archaeon]|nr:fructose-6-phosphate aldolase [Thermoplasmatales archaeon]
MKIFIDTANIEEIRNAWNMGVIDGVTTNPTLMSMEKMKPEKIMEEIIKIVKGPISLEATHLDSYKGIVEDAEKLSRLSKNVVVKIPMTEEGMKAVKILSKKGIKTNVTLVFSANQALLAAKAGADYVSPFIGRLDDIGNEGMQIVRDIIQIYKNYNFKTQVIVASVRHPMHVVEAAKIGAHVATIPPNVIKKMFRHSLTDAGIKRFEEDWKKALSFR